MFFVKGALERILNNCSKFYNQGHLESLSEKRIQDYYHQASMMGNSGLRGMACSLLCKKTLSIIKQCVINFLYQVVNL
jgi:magnesium-transporting ATPase (P-type)